MEHAERRWTASPRAAWLAALGSCVLAGCSLITSFDIEADAEAPSIEEADAAVLLPPDEQEDASAQQPGEQNSDAGDTPAPVEDAAVDPGPGPDEDAAEPTSDAGLVTDAGTKPPPPSGADAMVPTTPGQMPEADAGPAVKPPTPVKDLIDAVGDEQTQRMQRVCRCPGAASECVLSGVVGKSECLERGLEAFSGLSEDATRELLMCLLPAEQAYTECVMRRVNCADVQTSMSTCTLQYNLATARCSTSSLQGLSLQGLCSRSR